MNTSQLKSYAPAARRNFIDAVTTQAARFGISADGILPVEVKGDVTMFINDVPFEKSLLTAHKQLVKRVRDNGFHATIDAIAYTWFNRFAAIRYMELHGYLDHAYRILSHPDEGKNHPEILDHATDVDLPGLDRAKAVEWKLEGTKDEELYRLLLKAQCNALHSAMPFLFERVAAADELLLPSNLLHTDSLIRKMVESVDEKLWDEIEIIGWLYQFYISERKDEVIGKVVASEDIPAATQLFTPNWIVKYMVQNSLGAQWMATYPDSPLKAQMEYYIEPAEQTDEVNAQLAAITPSQLNPEELTLIDPASGSGHILVEAYDLFKAIYLERGYRQQDVPKLILEKNLFGLDIDGRAAQLTGFALMMKGRADDRRLFERGVKLNVMALVNSTGFDPELIAQGMKLSDYGLQSSDLTDLKDLFEHATTFGSLIQVPGELAEKLPALNLLSQAASQDLFVSEAIKHLCPLVQQAEMLAAQYDAVVANPPYMGSKGMNVLMKKFAKDHFPDAKNDLFACFMERALSLTSENSRYSLITMPSWLFLSSFEKLREKLFASSLIVTLLHMGRGIFGIDFGSAAFVVQKTTIGDASGCYFRLHKRNFQHIHIADIAQLFRNSLANVDFRYDFDSYRSRELIPSQSMPNGEKIQFSARQSEFKVIPGSPVVYWVSDALIDTFVSGTAVGNFADVKRGMTTSDNAQFLRFWPEISFLKCCLTATNEQDASNSKAKWFPYSKGGGYRKWYGFLEYFVNWEDSGRDVIAFAKTINSSFTRTIVNISYYFMPSVGFPYVTSGLFSMRAIPAGCIYDSGGPGVFASDEKRTFILGCMNSSPASIILKVLNPTVNLQIADVIRLPLPSYTHLQDSSFFNDRIPRLVALARQDWDTLETSWDFQLSPLLTSSNPTLESSYDSWTSKNSDTIAEMKGLEDENNHLFINAYGLADELTPDVPTEQITLTVNPAYRYRGKVTKEEQWSRFREDSMEELVSYAIGCMMGRYSLDAPGLIYAHSGNEGFDPTKYTTFPADEDGIVPLTDTAWFEDDATHRLIEFISVAWPVEHLEENLTFLADNLGPKKDESARETIRRWLCDKFFKDHHLGMKRYKKRPIYWLFKSGKLKAFQCLVYLHRYNEGTLSRMRAEYVIPLQGKMAARIEKLEGDINAATSTAQRKRLEKEKTKLEKQQMELRGFDEKLRHYADKRITLDLDDGVKVNYGKFGDLLAEVKAVTGKKPEVG